MIFTYLLNVFFCYFLRSRYFTFIDYLPVLREFGLLVLVNLVIIVAVAYSIKFAGLNIPVVALTVASFLYFLILALVNKTFGINQLVTLHLGGILKKILSYGTSRSRQ
jgi:hypothetical protein